MSPQKQRKQAPKKTTFLASLLRSIGKDRKSSKSPPSSASSPAAAQMASRTTSSSSCSPEISTVGARAAATISATNADDSPHTPLTRAASSPIDVRRSDAHLFTPSTLLDYGPSPGERPSPRSGTDSLSTRPHQLAGRPDSGSRSPRDGHRRRDACSRRGGDSDQPGHAEKITPPSREQRVRKVAQKGIAATKPPAATGTSGVQVQQVATPAPQPGAICPVDDIIADLLKPHPVLVAQAQARAKAEKTSEPQCRKADVYGPCQVTRRRQNRVYKRHDYLAWSHDQLLREVNLRRLRSESKDRADLVDILIINDNKFSETWYRFRELSVHELLEEAEIHHVNVDFGKRWIQQELLTEIAERIAQRAVNDLPRAEAAARKSAQALTARALKVPSVDNGRSKVTKRGQKVMDRATLRKTIEDFAEDLFEADAAKGGPEAGTKKEVTQSKSKKTGEVSAKKARSKTIAKKVDQKSEKDGERPKLISSVVFITCTMTSDGKGKVKSLTASPGKKLDKGRDIKQEASPSAQREVAPIIKKRYLPVEKDEGSENHTNVPQPKRMRMATDTIDNPTPENRDHDLEEGKIDERPSSTKIKDVGDHATKRQAAPERKKLAATGAARSKKARSISQVSKDLSPAIPKASPKRTIWDSDDENGSSEEMPLQEIARIKRRRSSESSQETEKDHTSMLNDRPIKKAKLKGIPAEERVKGVAYTKLADGSYKAAQRIQKVGKVAKAKADPAEPSKNYIKR